MSPLVRFWKHNSRRPRSGPRGGGGAHALSAQAAMNKILKILKWYSFIRNRLIQISMFLLFRHLLTTTPWKLRPSNKGYTLGLVLRIKSSTLMVRCDHAPTPNPGLTCTLQQQPLPLPPPVWLRVADVFVNEFIHTGWICAMRLVDSIDGSFTNAASCLRDRIGPITLLHMPV